MNTPCLRGLRDYGLPVFLLTDQVFSLHPFQGSIKASGFPYMYNAAY